MESAHKNPKLAEIDIALTRLETTIKFAADKLGYEISKSHDGAFNIPRRQISFTTNLENGKLRHQAEILIAVPIDIRLDRGFYPDIPLSINASATLQQYEPFKELIVHRTIAEEVFYHEVTNRLPEMFSKITSLHEKWDAEFVAKYGKEVQEFITRLEDDGD